MGDGVIVAEKQMICLKCGAISSRDTRGILKHIQLCKNEDCNGVCVIYNKDCSDCVEYVSKLLRKKKEDESYWLKREGLE